MSTKTVLVTGGGRGIGQGIVEGFARQGMTVHCLDLRETTLEAAEQAQNAAGAGKVIGHVGDIRDEEYVNEFCAKLVADHGVVDILINNAGITPKKADGQKALLEDWDTALWEEVFRVNVTAPFWFCRALLPAMKKQGWGRIINMSSQAGRTKSSVASSCYSGSKGAVLGLSRTLADEAAPFGVTVNCIAPGRIDTPLAAVAGSEVNTKYASAIPVGRLGTPDDISAIAEFLASERASFLTGITIDATGGFFMI